MSVSAPTGASNVDLETIIAGGPMFAERLDAFRTAAKDARETKALAEKLMAKAVATKAEAEKQLAENQAAAKELAKAEALAKAAEAKFTRKYEEILAAARE